MRSITCMMTSSNGNIFSVTALCPGNSPVSGEFPAQRPVTRSFDVFFDLRPNKRLSKQWWGGWFEMPWSPLWRHCNGIMLIHIIPSAAVKRNHNWSCVWLSNYIPTHNSGCYYRSMIYLYLTVVRKRGPISFNWHLHFLRKIKGEQL